MTTVNLRIRMMLLGGNGTVYIPIGYGLAQRLPNGNILVNLDRMGHSFNIKVRWARRRVDRLAHIYAPANPILPVAFISLNRAPIHHDSIALIERRGRECVFQAKGHDGVLHYFLSGFDRNEWPVPLYFLAELPREVASIKEAREALKPPSVLQAEEMGKRVYRQGDMFAIPTRITDEEILKQGGIIEDREVLHGTASSLRSVRARSLYGTAHTATRVASMPNGTQLAWDYLYHEPSLVGRRGRDHRPCPLHPGRWHLVARNTVPIAKTSSPPLRPTRARMWGLSDAELRIIFGDHYELMMRSGRG